MPTNDFKPFAVGGAATVVSQVTYAAAAAILANGFQNGVADPAYLNKVWRQSSIIAASIGDFIVAQSGQNAVDDGTTATLVANLTTAIKNVIGTVQSSTTPIATTGGNTVLTAAQAAASFFVVTGALTSNASIIVPAAYDEWTVVNNTTGGFFVTVYCSGGGGVPVFQGGADKVFCDGANVRYSELSAITRTAGDSTKATATTEFVTGAITTAVSGLQTQIDTIKTNLDVVGSAGDVYFLSQI